MVLKHGWLFLFLVVIEKYQKNACRTFQAYSAGIFYCLLHSAVSKVLTIRCLAEGRYVAVLLQESEKVIIAYIVVHFHHQGIGSRAVLIMGYTGFQYLGMPDIQLFCQRAPEACIVLNCLR